MSFLKREQAPITDGAWNAIDLEARNAFRAGLIARRVVDVHEPQGWDYSAVNLGHLSLSESTPVEGVGYGLRDVRPLVETRTVFELDMWSLDDISRGATDVDLSPVSEAARRSAEFEDRAILNGLEAAEITGLYGSQAHEPIVLEEEPDDFLRAVTTGMLTFSRASIDGPFALLLDPESFRFVSSAPTGYPFSKRARALIRGPILESPLLRGGLLLSTRGGDFEMRLGQDFSIGYEGQEGRTLRFFISETFSFRLVEPAATARLTRGPSTDKGE